MWQPICKLTQEHGEVLAHAAEWIDDDFNPKGIRSGFIGGDGSFISAYWNDTFDSYENNEEFFPDFFLEVPFELPTAKNQLTLFDDENRTEL